MKTQKTRFFFVWTRQSNCFGTLFCLVQIKKRSLCVLICFLERYQYYSLLYFRVFKQVFFFYSNYNTSLKKYTLSLEMND